MDDNAMTIFAIGGIIFKLQQVLKARQNYQRFVTTFPGADKWAHRIIAGAFSLLAASGIHYTLDGGCSFADGCRGTFSIPDGMTLLHGLWEWTKVYMVQQGWYDFTSTPKPAMAASTAHTINPVPVQPTGPTNGGHS